MKDVRNLQIANVKKLLDLSTSSEVIESVTNMVCDYVRKNYQAETDSLEDAVNKALECMGSKDIPFFESLLEIDEIANNRKMYKRIETRIFDIRQNM